VWLPLLIGLSAASQVVSRQYLGGDNTLHISFWLVCRSVLIFLGAPLVAAIITRYIGIAIKGREWYDKVLDS